MAKPIMLNAEIISAMVKEFEQAMKTAKLSDGRVNYIKNFTYQGEDDIGASVMFTPLAYVKMLSLLNGFSSEVAWHGTVDRRSENLFVITDIMVYPQEVTGATVNTDQEKYQKWLMEFDDEVFNSLRMQAHSHVNMGVTPSSTDLTHQEAILQQLDGNGYYIFMIWNKSLSHNIKIYDFANNTLYEDSDITVGVMGDDFDLKQFMEDAKSVVSTKTYNTGSAYNTNTYAPKNTAPKSVSEAKKRAKGKSKLADYPDVKQQAYSGYYGFGNSPQDKIDYDELIYGGYR